MAPVIAHWINVNPCSLVNLFADLAVAGTTTPVMFTILFLNCAPTVLVDIKLHTEYTL